MYRRTSASEERHLRAPFPSGGRRFSSEDEDRSGEHIHREADVYIRSRTFQNSNWRQPQAPNLVWDNAQALSRRDIAAVNSVMPHFLAKRETNYTPSLSAVDNLTPKFVQMHLKTDISPTEELAVNQNAASASTSRHHPREWPQGLSSNNRDFIRRSLKNKIYNAYKLTGEEKKLLSLHGRTELDMLMSKSLLYDIMNNLDGKTTKVKTEFFTREESARDHVKQEMVALFPNCNVIPYGIRLLGLAHPETAVYMFFDAGHQYHKGSNENKKFQNEVRSLVYDKLCNCGHCEAIKTWDNQELVTFTHKESHMNCVVSFTNGFKHLNTLLLRTYLALDKRLRLLVLIINELVYRYHDLSKFYTTYAINIMIIMYLQSIQEPVLPTLTELRKNLPCEKVYIGGFDCSFPPDVSSHPQSNNQDSTEKLLKGFCGFYKDFNWDEDIVSILGPRLKRSFFSYPYEIDESMDSPAITAYINALKSDDESPRMKLDHSAIVQDPFELNSNAAEKVNATVIEVFTMMCEDSYNILSKWC